MNQKPVEMTAKSLEKLKEELHDLEHVQLPATVKRVSKAREQGDLSENSEYHDARDQQEFLEVRIGEVQEIIGNVVIVQETRDKNKVGFGSTVTIEDEKGKQKTYTIVGEYADNAQSGDTITSESPVGAALLGKAKGETIEIVVPNGLKTIKIIEIK